jgi:hypothetical protein
VRRAGFEQGEGPGGECQRTLPCRRVARGAASAEWALRTVGPQGENPARMRLCSSWIFDVRILPLYCGASRNLLEATRRSNPTSSDGASLCASEVALRRGVQLLADFKSR